MPEQDNDAELDETKVEDVEKGEDENQDGDADPEGAEQLGDAGKKALDSMKARFRDERTKRRAAEAALAEANKAKSGSKPEGDDDKSEAPDSDQIRREVEAELKARLEAEQARERVLDKIEVKAAKSFTNPAIAVAMLRDKVNDFLDDDGKPDLEAIQDALKELLENEPYLAAAQGGKRFQGTGDGGARPAKPSRPKSLDEAVRTRLST
jgi:hypothetical protein